MELYKKTTILFTPEMHQFLLKLAKRRGTSLGELVRLACELQYGFTDPKQRLSAVDSLAALQLPVDSPDLMARDALNVAVYRACDAHAFYSYDADVDVIEFINRCEPDPS